MDSGVQVIDLACELNKISYKICEYIAQTAVGSVLCGSQVKKSVKNLGC